MNPQTQNLHIDLNNHLTSSNSSLNSCNLNLHNMNMAETNNTLGHDNDMGVENVKNNPLNNYNNNNYNSAGINNNNISCDYGFSKPLNVQQFNIKYTHVFDLSRNKEVKKVDTSPKSE